MSTFFFSQTHVSYEKYSDFFMCYLQISCTSSSHVSSYTVLTLLKRCAHAAMHTTVRIGWKPHASRRHFYIEKYLSDMVHTVWLFSLESSRTWVRWQRLVGPSANPCNTDHRMALSRFVQCHIFCNLIKLMRIIRLYRSNSPYAMLLVHYIVVYHITRHIYFWHGN
jgi:hypothetical protein